MTLQDQLWTSQVDPAFVHKARDFARERIAPVADEIDRKDYYPVELVKALAKEGLCTLTLEKGFGGSQLPFAYAVAALEEIAVASAAVAICMITIYQAQSMMRLFAQDSLKAVYLPQFAQGLLSSYALTEAGHGSDIRTLDTTARRTACGGWQLDGEKHFITSGSAAELFVILAQAEQGVSVFAVPSHLKGLTLYKGHNSATFGLRNGPHMNLKLEGVELPADHLIGTEGKGVRQAVTVLDFSRTLAAGISIGIARAAFEGSLDFAKSRVAFDRKILDFQGLQWYFSEMLSSIDSARLMVYRAATALDAHDDIARYSSEAKLLASATATQVASKAVQICGAYGTMENAPFGRYLRDAKAYEIAGGSSEILKNTIAKSLSAYLKNAEAAQ